MEYTDDDLRKMLRGEVNGAISLRQFALSKKLSPAYVSDALNGNRPIGIKIAKALLGKKAKAKRIWAND
jgi:hypothetical protein